MSADYHALAAFANDLAEAARTVTTKYFRTAVAADIQADTSPVTIADQETEALIREKIEATYPDHGIYGEEYGAVRTDAEFVWVLDPIDGTKSFITGRPIFGTLIALVQNGVPVLGVIDQPVNGERWIGAAGHETRFNGAVVQVRDCPALASAVVGTTAADLFDTDQAKRWQTIAATAAPIPTSSYFPKRYRTNAAAATATIRMINVRRIVLATTCRCMGTP